MVMAFGRFNPPTTGHALLVHAAEQMGLANNAKVIIYVSRTQDKTKNPLTPEQKVSYLQEMFPGVDFRVSMASPSTVIGEARLLSQLYGNLVMVAGGDRADEFRHLLEDYNGEEYTFESIRVVSSGDRDPDSASASGMSASKMRDFARRGNLEAFVSGVKPYLTEQSAERMYNDVRVGMGLSEQVWFRPSKFHEGDRVMFEDATWKVAKAGSGYAVLESKTDKKTAWDYQMTKIEDAPLSKTQLESLKQLVTPKASTIQGFTKWVKSEQVEFSLDRRHGHDIGEQGTARGRNVWFFCGKPRGDVDYQNPAEFFQHSGRFCDARAAAAIWARQNGIPVVYVM